MRIENGMLVLEKRNCRGCSFYSDLEPGQIRELIPGSCPTCGGTGNGPRGKKNGCRACNGRGGCKYRVVTCPSCDGDPIDREDECYTDFLPRTFWQSMTFRVYRSNRSQTFNEGLLGIGCFYSVTDYGDHKNQTDEQLITKARMEHSGMQGCKFVRSKDDLRVCDHVGIFTSEHGYSVRPVFEPDAVDAKVAILSERSYHEGMLVGQTVASQGGNGTMAGVYR